MKGMSNSSLFFTQLTELEKNARMEAKKYRNMGLNSMADYCEGRADAYEMTRKIHDSFKLEV